MKGKKQLLPDDAEFLEDPLAHRPIMATRKELPNLFPGLKWRTLSNMACEGRGPKFYRRGKITWYLIDDVQAWLMENPNSTSEDTT